MPSRPPRAALVATALTVAALAGGVPVSAAGAKPRARDLGVPFDGTPGPLNAITDVAGIEVGHKTLVSGEGKRIVGRGPVRTGVTAVWPRGKGTPDPVFAAWFSLNGDGEMTGTTWVEDSGLLEGPVMLTNTLSVGVVHHAVVRWGVNKSLGHQGDDTYPPWLASLPVVAETWDGTLNDIMGQHVKEEDALAAMESARGGPVAEGNVGGGTGMICHRFKGGIGTASRLVEVAGTRYTLGALVQCNYGSRRLLRVAGVPVGREIPDLLPEFPRGDADEGSIIVVVGTDAPLLPHQLERVARRVSLGLARNGSISGNGSGDLFVTFSTANREAARNRSGPSQADLMANESLDPLFEATVDATEEAIVNALVAAETMTGGDGVTVQALPHDRLREALRKYNRLESKAP
jgi:D-aminopeptidase